jgi:hypothetical protein
MGQRKSHAQIQGLDHRSLLLGGGAQKPHDPGVSQDWASKTLFSERHF